MATNLQLELLMSGQYSDLILVCKGHEFKVHRSYVCIVSSMITEKYNDAAAVCAVASRIMTATDLCRMAPSKSQPVSTSTKSIQTLCQESCNMCTPMSTRAKDDLFTSTLTQTAILHVHCLPVPLAPTHPLVPSKLRLHKSPEILRPLTISTYQIALTTCQSMLRTSTCPLLH